MKTENHKLRKKKHITWFYVALSVTGFAANYVLG